MALTRTTLSAAVGYNDRTVLLASITGLAVGNWIAVDMETMKVATVPASATTPVGVIRGQNGSKQVAHAITASVEFGVGSDFAEPVAGSAQPVSYPPTRARETKSYGVAGAIDLPTPGNDLTAIINGAVALAMTLANPTSDNDGDHLEIVGNGKAAHTVTINTAGLGNVGATADVLTFKADQAQAVILIAAAGFWVLPGAVAGAATIAGVGIA